MMILSAVSALEIGIAVGAIALVAFTIIFNIVRKKKGKSSCGCSGCSGCKNAKDGKCPGCNSNNNKL